MAFSDNGVHNTFNTLDIRCSHQHTLAKDPPIKGPARRRMGTVTRPVMDGLVLANTAWSGSRREDTLTPTSIETTFLILQSDPQCNGGPNVPKHSTASSASFDGWFGDKKHSTAIASISNGWLNAKNYSTASSSSSNSVSGDTALGKVKGSFLTERKVSDISCRIVEDESELVYFVT